MNDIIDVVCLVLPSGENLWFEPKGDYLSAVFGKWTKENPEYADSGCTCEAVAIKMPRKDYIAIGAKIGPGCFDFPIIGDDND